MLSSDLPIPKPNLLHHNRALPSPHSSCWELSCSQQPGRCVVHLSTDTHLCLDFLLHHHPHGSYHGEHGAVQPHIKASSGAEPSPPNPAPRAAPCPSLGTGMLPCPPQPVCCAITSGAAQPSPAPRAARGEHGTGRQLDACLGA